MWRGRPRGSCTDVGEGLEHGADPNACAADGTTALHMASVRGSRREVFEVLIEYGARLDLKDNSGKTALATARAAGKSKTASLLRSLGAR